VADGWFLLPRIWIAACRGETSAAIAEGLRVADILGSSGLRAQEAMALHDLARLGEPERVAERLVRLAESCDGLLIPAFARHASALVARDALALEEISRTFEQMGALLLAAESAAEASYAHRDLGSRREALAAAARARTLADLCEGARTPALIDIEEQLPLTRREREVAALAARGHTNQEIAERLVVSVRTVGNHLHSVYSKLEVTGREELRRFPGLI
jgi:ATP/maltotriose-dependent transcriptional regulator MalT